MNVRDKLSIEEVVSSVASSIITRGIVKQLLGHTLAPGKKIRFYIWKCTKFTFCVRYFLLRTRSQVSGCKITLKDIFSTSQPKGACWWVWTVNHQIGSQKRNWTGRNWKQNRQNSNPIPLVHRDAVWWCVQDCDSRCSSAVLHYLSVAVFLFHSPLPQEYSKATYCLSRNDFSAPCSVLPHQLFFH